MTKNNDGSVTMEVVMPAELHARFVTLLEGSKTPTTPAALLEQVVARGVYDVSYRRTRNAQQWAEFKAYRAQRG